MADYDDHWILFRLRRLDPLRFEELCCALLSAEGHEVVRHWGLGGAEGGVDIWSIGPDGKHWVTQCKRYREIKASDVRREVQKVIANPPEPLPQVYRLAATCKVTRAVDEALLEETRKASARPTEAEGDRPSFDLELASTWAATELVGMLRDKYPELRERFISPPMDEAGGPRWWVPYPPNPFFEGREEVLEELRRRLVEGSAGALCQGIGGLGGIGKTQTALEYAWRHRDEYEAVLWVRAETVEELRAGLVEMSRELKLPGVAAEGEENEVLAGVMSWLESTDGWLLVYDNADEPEILLPYLPRGGRGHVLVTSRANAGHLARTLRLSAPVSLDVLEPSEALRFLLERTLREEATSADEREAAGLAEDLGYLPLALEQAAAYMLETGVGFADYRASFEARRPEHLSKFQPADYHATVATTWAVNVERVGADHPEVLGLLEACAFYSPAEIPLELLLAAGWQATDEEGGAAELVKDRSRLSELLGPLVRFSLLTRDMERLTVGVHRLVQAVIFDGMDERRRREWVKRCVLAMRELFPWPEFSTWPMCRRLHLHALSVLQHVEGESLESLEVASLNHSLGSYADDRGAYEEAEPLFQRSLAIKEKALGPEHPEVAQTLNNLGILYRRQGRYEEAEPLYQRSLEIKEKALGEEHPEVAQTLNNLGLLYVDQGRYEEAEPLYQRDLAITEKALGQEHPEVATTLMNLGSLYGRLGRYEEAEPLYHRSLAIKEKALGQEHPEVAKTLNNLGSLYFHQGRYEEAEPLYQRSLAITEKALGEEHPDVAQTLNNLGNLYLRQGRHEEAEPLFQRDLAITEKALGEEHPQVAQTLNNLGLLCVDQGRYEEAEPLYQRSLAIKEKALGEEHPSIAITLENYSRLLRETDPEGRKAEIDAMDQRAAAIREKRS